MHEALLDLDLPSPPADIKMKVGRRFRKTALTAGRIQETELGVTSHDVTAPGQTLSFKTGPSRLLKAISTTFV